ncbi:hypothetical protein MHK_003228, partial [Candidatus Magnetomorum sp. HK-1]
ITYFGLEPIYDNTNTANRIIGLSNSDDTDAVLSQAGDQINLSGSTFEGITFNKPSASLTIQGLEGTDTITIQSLNLDSTELTIDAENIILLTGNTIESSANIFFNALDQDASKINSINDIQDRRASIEIDGNLNTSQNISLTASVIRDIHISDASEDSLNTETLSNAVIQMRNATINAAQFEVLASSDGVIITENTLANAKNSISEQVFAKIEESCQIAANQVTIRTSRGTDYQVTGRDAYNHISGDTQAWVKDSTITSNGDVSIFAEDSIKMSAESPEMSLDLSTIASNSTIGASSARNYLSGNVDAHLINSTLTVTGENTVSISAERKTQIKSKAQSGQLTESSGLLSGYTIELDGTYSSNVLIGHTKASIGSEAVEIDLSTEDFTNTSQWEEISTFEIDDIIPGMDLNISDSDSTAFGGLVVRNDVRSDVHAYINKANVSASGDIWVRAFETAGIWAQDLSTVESSGGSMFGGGSSNAVSAVIATNLVLSNANAYVTDSILKTSNNGDVVVYAENASTMIATISSHVKAGGKSVGVVLAFNTIGWDSQNILFNAIDSIFDTEIGDDNASLVKAYTKNTAINSSGSITVDAIMNGVFDALIENSATTIATSFGDNETLSVAPIISMNKLATEVEASISNATTLTAQKGDITVSAKDTSDMDVIVAASSVAIGVGAEEASGISIGISIANNELFIIYSQLTLNKKFFLFFYEFKIKLICYAIKACYSRIGEAWKNIFLIM